MGPFVYLARYLQMPLSVAAIVCQLLTCVVRSTGLEEAVKRRACVVLAGSLHGALPAIFGGQAAVCAG